MKFTTYKLIMLTNSVIRVTNNYGKSTLKYKDTKI